MIAHYAVRTLAARDVTVVSVMFRPCYARCARHGQRVPAGSGYRSAVSGHRSSRRAATAAPATGTHGGAAADDTPAYPGKRFGLPQAGPGSSAPMGRRFLALLIDWVLCEIIVAAMTRHEIFAATMDSHYFAAMYWTLFAFALEVWLLTALGGMTVGKRLCGIRVVTTGGGRPGFGWALLRTLLLLCVVPPLLSDRDLRGLHDRAADTIVVRI
jgi:uncharacterized RDD family membrane protein YckC